MKTLGLVLTFFSLVPHAHSFELSEQGRLAHFEYQGAAETISRTVVYYVPSSIQNPKDILEKHKLLVFLHGGGESTQTQDAATNTAEGYVEDVITYAEDNQVIVLAPTTIYGWNGSEVYALPELVKDVGLKIGVDQKHVVLAGHSMGGMAITRDFPRLNPFFSGFLVSSAGTQGSLMNSESQLLPYFNQISFLHQNGKNDGAKLYDEEKHASVSFDVEERELQDKLRTLENTYHLNASKQYVLTDRFHLYDFDLLYTQLDELFAKPQTNSQKYLYLNFERLQHVKASGKQPGEVNATHDSLFWIGLRGYDERANASRTLQQSCILEVKVEGQTINLIRHSSNFGEKSYLLKLTPQLIDLEKPIRVKLNDNTIFSGRAQMTGENSAEIQAFVSGPDVRKSPARSIKIRSQRTQ